MKIRLIIYLILVFQTILCNSQNLGQFEKNKLQGNYDTLVSKNLIFDEESHETEYFVVTGNDTSDFEIVFSQNADNGKIYIIAKYELLYKKGKLYKTRIIEFEKILQSAKHDFNYDSLSTIVLGRLVSTGDLAIAVTNEFIKKYGNKFEKVDYTYVPKFLLESKLAKDINKLFRPYSLQLDNISIEKLGFIPSKYITASSIIDTPKSEIPEKIIDCMIWIELKKLKK